jgi:hypothetical protein
MLEYSVYNRRFGLFKNSQLDIPVVYPIARLQLPKRALLHFAPVDGVTMGPQISDPMLRSIPGVIYIYHETQYHDPIGGPQRKYTNAQGMITEFRRKNRAFRPLKNLERLDLDDRVLPVFNYAMLSHLVKYPPTFRSSYYQWYNVMKEVVLNVNKTTRTSRRQQFIEIDLPDVMPTLTQLRELAARQSSDTLKHFGSAEMLTMADLFKWAGPLRKESLFGQIDPEQYGKINLIFRRLNGWVSVNLKWLDDFIISPKEVIEEYKAVQEQLKKDPNAQVELPIVKLSGMESKIFQLKFLRMLYKLHQATSPLETPTKEEVVDEKVVTIDTPDEKLDDLEFGMDANETVDEDDVVIDEIETISALEKELEDLERVRTASQTEEVFDEEGNVIDTKTIDIDVLQTKHVALEADGSAMLIKADELQLKGFLSPADHNRLKRLAEAHKNIKDPYGSGESLVEAMKIAEEDLIIEPKPITDDKTVIDRSMLHSRVDEFDKQYIEKTLRKDILRCVMAIQKSPVAVTGYTVEYEQDAVTDNEIHIVKLVPAVGLPSTVRFAIPRLRPNGTFLYKGTEYRMRKQRTDLPIRKISPSRVALSSYYSKVFVERSERKTFDMNRWFVERLVMKAQDTQDPVVHKAVLSTVVDYKADVPLIYTEISERLLSFSAGKLNFWFDHRRRIAQNDYSERELAFEKDGWVLVGRGPKGALIMDKIGAVYSITGGKLEDEGSIFELCGIPIEAGVTPTMMAEVKVYSKNIPIGVALGYLLGLDGLLKITKAKVRRVLMSERANLTQDEFAVRFKNETLVFDRNNPMVSMIFSGFNLFHESIKSYNSGMFNDKDVYAAVLDRSRIGSRYLRELDSLNTLFVDPITEDLLKWMGEPRTFTGLLIRSVEMLTTAQVSNRREDKNKRVELLERIRGYERVPGIIYETLAKAVRQYNARAAGGRGSVTINPNDPTNILVMDPTTSPVNNINPIHALREREVVTYTGRGGRSRRAMVASARLFPMEDLGFMSEGTVDSGDVAIITYMSPNANLTTTRGTVRLYDAKRDGNSCIMSTSAQLAFDAEGDDPKRRNFINVQHGHGIMAEGYEVPAARTGMERAIAGREGPEFAVTATGKGEITELSADHIAVKYEDGRVERHELGLIHTNAEGSSYPNTLATTFKLGDKVNEFDVLAYNRGFFKPDPINPRRVDYMAGCMARIALREAVYTVEDSCSLSIAFAQRMRTYVSKEKPITVNFDYEINNLVNVGDTVDLKTILCDIRGAVSSDDGLYDEADREVMGRLAGMAPEAGAVGVVSKVEVFYCGDVDDMSESLQAIVTLAEKERRRKARRLGKDYTSGQVPRGVRIGKNALENQQAVIIVHMTVGVPMGTADKLVVGNQMKSTVGETLFGNNRTLTTNEPIDMIFGAKSPIDRIILGPFSGGSTNTLMRYVGEEAFQMYFG